MIDVSVKAPLAELRPKAAKLRKELTRYGRQIAIPHWLAFDHSAKSAGVGRLAEEDVVVYQLPRAKRERPPLRGLRWLVAIRGDLSYDERHWRRWWASEGMQVISVHDELGIANV